MEKRCVVPRPKYIVAVKNCYRKLIAEAFFLAEREKKSGKNLIISYASNFTIFLLPVRI